MWAVPAALVVAAGCAVVGLWPEALAVVVALLAMACWPVRTTGDVTASEQALRRLLVVLVVVGLALTMFVEFYVARNVDIGRTNTVFKHYLQVWVMWAVAAAVSVGIVYERLPSLPRWIREVWRVAFVLLFVSALLYPVLAARAKIQDRFDTSVGRTLDGTAFMAKAVFSDKAQAIPFADDRDAIRWMHENVEGSPVVAEANTTPTLYGWQGRYSWFTGNPTIVGWDFHQRQQRPPQSEEVQARVADVQKAYRTKRSRGRAPDPRGLRRLVRRGRRAGARVLPRRHREVGGGRRALLDARVREPGRPHLPPSASEDASAPSG